TRNASYRSLSLAIFWTTSRPFPKTSTRTGSDLKSFVTSFCIIVSSSRIRTRLWPNGQSRAICRIRAPSVSSGLLYSVDLAQQVQPTLGEADDIDIFDCTGEPDEIRDSRVTEILCHDAGILGLHFVGARSANQDDAVDLINLQIGDVDAGASEHGGQIDRLGL